MRIQGRYNFKIQKTNATQQEQLDQQQTVEYLQVFLLFLLLIRVVVEVERGRGGGYKEGTMSARANVALADFCNALTNKDHQDNSEL